MTDVVSTLKYCWDIPHNFRLESQMHFTEQLLKNVPKFNFCSNLRAFNLHIPTRLFLKKILKASCALTAILHLYCNGLFFSWESEMEKPHPTVCGAA